MVAKTYVPSFWLHPLQVTLLPGWEMVDAFYGSDSDLLGLETEQWVPYAFLAKRAKDGTNHLFFRGTVGRLEWGEDFEALHAVVPFLEHGSLGHAGFLKIYFGLHTLTGDTISTRCGGLEVTCHGHSLGAALASIAAAHLAHLPARNTLWAAPRAFSPFAVNAIAQMNLDFTHVANPADIVHDLPPAGLGWAHVVGGTFPVHPKVKDGTACHHSMQSYLNALDPSEPLEDGCSA